MALHADQLDVDDATVRTLVDTQFPRWSALPVRRLVTSGTVNAIFRLGDGLVARFPLQGEDPAEAERTACAEFVALAELGAVSTVPTPAPVALGAPGAGYPLAWSVQTWLPGADATVEDPADSVPFALDLAALIRALREADTRGRRFAGTGRGGHLPDHDPWLAECFDRSAGLLDVPSLRALWDDLRTLPSTDPDAMCHGDLTPPNVLVRDGRLAGVLDGGGFAPADPALDLVGAWHLLDAAPREVLRTELACSDIQWARGAAWALQQAMGLVWYYVDTNPSMSRWGRRTLDRLLVSCRTRGARI